VNDDDLTRALEAWAGTTDPGDDPITADEVAAADDPVAPAAPPRGRSRRWLAVAAAVLVVAGLAAAVAVAVAVDRAGGPDEVVADGDGGTSAAGSTQIVVDAPDLDRSWWQVAHRVSLWGPCRGAPPDCGDDPVVARALEPGASLVLDQPLDPGRWRLRVERFDCTATEAQECGAPSADGTPTAAVEPTRCDVNVDVGPRASTNVVAVASAGGTLTCTIPTTDEVPELTVPPDWSLRPELPWACGAATHDINGQIPGSDPEGAEVALGCFRDAVADGTAVEIPVAELQAGDGLTRSWWRVLPEPVDGRRVEVLRDWGLDGVHGWARLRCDDVEVETQELEAGEGLSGLYVGARPVGCDDEEPLALDLPPLAESSTPPTTTGTTAAGPAETIPAPPTGTVDVVLDVDRLPVFIEGSARRWSIAVDGVEDEAGPLTEIGGWGDRDAGEQDVQLVRRALPLDEAAGLTVTVEDFDCFAPGRCRPDTMGPVPGAAADDSCRAEAPTERTGPVLVVTLRDSTCIASWTRSVPPLTVPPTWSLRTADDGSCATVATDDRWAQCLADALATGTATTEYTQYADDGSGRVTYRVAQDGVEVLRRRSGPDATTVWTVQTCTGLEVGGGGRLPKPTGCDDEAPLPLTP
jgi:hypothetical protein